MLKVLKKLMKQEEITVLNQQKSWLHACIKPTTSVMKHLVMLLM